MGRCSAYLNVAINRVALAEKNPIMDPETGSVSTTFSLLPD
jgi:hypothetical protein